MRRGRRCCCVWPEKTLIPFISNRVADEQLSLPHSSRCSSPSSLTNRRHCPSSPADRHCRLQHRNRVLIASIYCASSSPSSHSLPP
ncbi:unnamed protein product [Linum trigynum]|uniref:Uncharacterized protein n=1 Tax=Linum trigynum TaxID=586398 RepID=A0AAV2GF33_9ROSI